ncbi:MAG: NADH-quinone oxidoreductase subunit E [Rhodobacterales bacterium CG2_30_65_12]|nr:MAG: NADH-quinone oxidoreductase subunit E [Rhodobacterales bacterium CG2_30_65_12]
MPDITPNHETIATEIAAELGREGPLLPILHRLQSRFGHVPEAAVPMIAEALNIGRAEVHGVMSFYHDFLTVPAGRHMVKICRAEACQAVGGVALAEGALAALGTVWHGTSANGAVTVEPVYCLGLCANGPAAMVDGKPMAAATVAKLAAEVGQ